MTVTFSDLGLGDDVLKAISDLGYTSPTPIQEQAIPLVLQMRDVLGCAQTGTGKTAGFVLPMLEILSSGRARARMPRSLIIEPTRELATQVEENFRNYGKYHSLSTALLIGGETMDEQIRNLDRGVDVLIATPGRMLDLHERGKVMLNDIKIFVIDEADRMLDMGFIPDVERIAGLLPPLRQTLFFSATMPPEIKKLADRFLRNPKSVTVAPSASTAEGITQRIVNIPSRSDWQKREALRILLRRENVQNAFIFCNRKRDVAMLHRSLQKHGFNAGALHGDMGQSDRTATLDKFRAGEIALLVCSDVAARGLDIADVSHVFNFDVPFNAEDYVHRIGRTGRAGKSGAAITFAMPEDGEAVDAVEKLIRMKISRENLEGLPEADLSRERNSRPRGREGSDKRGTGSRRPHPPSRRAEKPSHNGNAAMAADRSPATPHPAAAKQTATHRPPPQSPAAPRPEHQHSPDSPKSGFGADIPAFLRGGRNHRGRG